MNYHDYLDSHTECPFCPGPSRSIIEQNHALLTYALAPYHKHHLLVIPKRHIENILDVTSDELSEIDALQKIGLKMLKQLGYENITLLVREGKNSGKTISHLHFHVIPEISLGSTDHAGADRQILADDEVERLLEEFRMVLEKVLL